MTIYKTLLKHLLQYVHPCEFVQQDYFDVAEDCAIIAVPGKCPDLWQTRAALLFMQETYSLIRRIRREIKDIRFPHPAMLEEFVNRRLASARARATQTSTLSPL